MKLARSVASIAFEVAVDIGIAAGLLVMAALVGGTVFLIVVSMGPPS